MIIEPKVRGFVCVTAHPTGCEAHVQEQINTIKSQPALKGGPKKVLVIGASTGYGLASRIAATFGSQADTLGIFFERPSTNGRPASAGWYNSVAFEKAAKAEGRYAKSFNGDAFSAEMKAEVIKEMKENFGPADLIVYSLAAPRRTDAAGNTYKSVLKPTGEPFTANTVNTDKNEVHPVTLEPANADEVAATIKVMGGEDWEIWINDLQAAGLIAQGAKTVAYSYIGPEVTWPIYKNGTIGQAKQHLDATAIKLNKQLKESLGGEAYVSVNKAVVTQASSAIPVVPLYLSALLKIMAQRGNDEGCIEQIARLFATRLYGTEETEPNLQLDEANRIRIDDWELSEDIQAAINELWPKLNTETLRELTVYDRYQAEFLKLFGFGLPGVDYSADVPAEAVEAPLE